MDFIVDTNKNIYSLCNSTMNGKTYLKWMSSGLSQFLIVYGENKQVVDLSNKIRQEYFSQICTSEVLNELLVSKNVWLKSERMQLYLFTHDELKRDGGVVIKENPGVYAVYGFNFPADAVSPTIYVSPDFAVGQNMLTMYLEVSIEREAYYVEKRSFLKKVVTYSGYNQIRLSKGYPGLVGGVLKYRINDYTFPFPDSVVKNGGSFFVKADENCALDFVTNNPGIKIK